MSPLPERKSRTSFLKFNRYRREVLRQGLLVTSGIVFPLRLRTIPAQDIQINPRTDEAIDRALSWLASRRNPDGSFGNGDYAGNCGVLGLIAIAFLASGSVPGRGRWGELLEQTVQALLDRVQPNGLFSSPRFRSRGPMYEHAFSALALTEVLGTHPVPSLRPILQRAVRLIIDSQNDAGGWRYEPRRDDADVSVTAAQVMALRAARNAGMFVPDQVVQRAVTYLKQSQNPDGGFRYMENERESAFPRSAAAIVALYNSGIPAEAEIERGLKYLERFPPEVASGPLPSHFFYGHYYAVQAMWHAGGDRWERWYTAIRDLLLDRQAEEGNWDDLLSSDYATAMAAIVLQVPNDLLPILQR